MKYKINFMFLSLLTILVLFGVWFVGATISSFNPSSPSNQTWTNDNQPDFTFTAISNINTSFSCELFVDAVGYGVNSTVTNNTVTLMTANNTLSDGSRTWYVNCTDVNGTMISSVNILNIDTIDPKVIVFSPSNNSIVLNFLLNATLNGTQTTVDNSSINLTLINSSGGTNNYAYTDMTCASSDSDKFFECNITPTISYDTYNYTLFVKDSSGAGNSFTATGYNITVDYSCFGVFSTTGLACSSHGNCDSQDFCACDSNYVGDQCQFYDAQTPTPQNLVNSSQNNESVYLTWTAVSAQKYLIYQDSSNLYNTTNSFYNVTGLTPVTGYAFNITAYNSSNNISESNFSATINIVTYQNPPDVTPPNTAPNVTQSDIIDSDSDGNIEVSWTADPNAVYYKLYRASSNITSAVGLTAIASVYGTSFEDNTTSDGTTYWYALTSVDGSDNENTSVVSASFSTVSNDTINPKLPTNVDAATGSNGAVAITWDAVTLDVSENPDLSITYYVFRTTDISSLNTSATTKRITTTTSITYTDNSMTTGTNYTYVVTAVDDGGNHNDSKTSQKNIVPSACTTSWSSWSECTGGSQTRTRTCYGGGATSQNADCGSGGGSSRRPSDDIITPKNPSATWNWQKITPGAATIMKIYNAELGLKEIHIEVNNQKNDVRITIEKLPGRPASVTHQIKGKVYRYFEINTENLVDSDLGSNKIRFVVAKTWLNQNNLAKDRVALYRYNNRWQQLDTTVLSETATEIEYEATTPGFSYFVVGETEIVIEPPQQVIEETDDEIEPEQPPEIQPNAQPRQDEIIPVRQPPLQEPPKIKFPSYTGALILVIIGGLVYYYLHYDKITKKKK